MRKLILYVHGKGGNAAEAEQYKKSCLGYDIVGVEYKGNLPRVAKEQIAAAYDALCGEYGEILLLANSIGAYFAMSALQGRKIEKAFFISPVPDMEKLILDMARQAGVTEAELKARGEIPTDLGETLSWEYLDYVRKNPIVWNIPTQILYAENDDIVSREIVDGFAHRHAAVLTVMKGGEHWFHTEEQTAFLNDWLSRSLYGKEKDHE